MDRIYLVHPVTLCPRNLSHEAFNDLVAFLKSGIEVFGLVAAAFGHVGFAATAAADDWGEFFDYLPGGNL